MKRSILCNPCRSWLGIQPLHLPLSIAVLILLHSAAVVESKFNGEVVKRVSEKLNRFMDRPNETLKFMEDFVSIGGFPNLGPLDRDLFFSLSYILPTQPNIYVALEDGTLMGVGEFGDHAFYREPGESGYELPIDESSPNYKYWISCFDRDTGEKETCTMDHDEQSLYIECIDECELDKCPDVDSQRDCSAIADKTDRSACEEKISFCPKYRVRSINEKANADKKFGYIPRTYHCVDRQGRVTQEPGTCYFRDDTMPVDQTLEGKYSYCGGEECNPFIGAYRSRDYDPRYRGWYIESRGWQKPLWTKPHASFTSAFSSFEIAYTSPIYTNTEEGHRIFRGVMGVDYDLNVVTQFLIESYHGTDVAVAIFEWDEPNYLIATSTGSLPVMNALADNENEPCPIKEDSDNFESVCIPSRVKMSRLTGDTMDRILARAFIKQKEAGFPELNLVSVNLNDEIGSPFFISTVSKFERPVANLTWGFVVAMPGITSQNGITQGDAEFGLMCTLAAFGAFTCLVFFGTFVYHRKERAIVVSDWRFSCLFFLGCAALNLGVFTFLGENTDATCMARMWTFHMLFVICLAPLFAKILRMKMLMSAASSARRKSITHRQTLLMTLPLIILQAIILLIFTFVDPPIATQTIENPETPEITEHIECAQSTCAFFVVQIVYKGGLILAGCTLAYMTREMDSKFGESKQLIFAMSNIGLIVAIILIFSVVLGQGESKKVLYAIGIFWGTVISSCAFAMPRLLSVRKAQGIVSGLPSTNIKGLSRPISNLRPQEPTQRTSEEQFNLNSGAANRSGSDDVEKSTEKQ